jgi:hypothetical protein
VVSIVVNNFNYAEFVGRAIESALRQRGTPTEVLVVDDGSSDGSLDVIRRYEPLVSVVAKRNGGQASAFNAGFAASTGDVVIFLDADDELLPDTAAQVARRFDETPGTVKVHYRLRAVGEGGRPLDSVLPPATVQLPDGDIRANVLRSPHDVAHPPTSGNAFAREALERILPMPEPPYRRLADVYLLNLVSLVGPVARLDDIAGLYRVHGRNTHHRTHLDLAALRSTIEASAETERHLSTFADALGLAAAGSRRDSVTDLAQRLVSRKLAPDQHPVPSDRPLPLALRGIVSASRRHDLPLGLRLLYTAWFCAAAVAPRRIVRTLGTRLVTAWQRGTALPSRARS